jgi:hypothetical protein
VTDGESLRLLRDVPGVVGSCLLDGQARVLVRDVPAEVGDDLLAGIGRRADAALSAAAAPMPGTTGVVLRFARLAVFCSRAGINVLLVLCVPEASTTSVKVAMQASAPALARVLDPVPEPTTSQTSPSPRRRGDGIWG